jgi:hypothetical protein
MGIGTALGIGGIAAAGIGAAGSIGAASQQAGAAKDAAQLQYESAQQALEFQKQQWATQQQNIAPWLQTGQGAIGNLGWLLGVTPGGMQQSPWGPTTPGGYSAAPGMATAPTVAGRPAGAGPLMGAPGARILPEMATVRAGGGAGTTRGVGGLPPATNRSATPPPGFTGGQAGSFGSLLQGWNQPFVPPTAATEQNDPGYRFRLSQGLQALQNSAAARGGLLSGNTLQGIEQYAQDYASNEYQNVYNRSLGQYQQNYNIFQQNQANEFNRLAALAGIGQTAAGQLAGAGSAAAGNVGNILLGSAGQIGQSLQNAGAARASGYAGAANAATGAIGNLSQYAMLQNLLGNQSDNIDWSQISWG